LFVVLCGSPPPPPSTRLESGSRILDGLHDRRERFFFWLAVLSIKLPLFKGAVSPNLVLS